MGVLGRHEEFNGLWQVYGHDDPFAIGSPSSPWVLRANKHGDPLVNGKNAALQEWILILPDGQISSCFAVAPVQPHLQKYFRILLTRIKSISVAVSSHRGAIARRHERGAGCGGREGVRRVRQSQGEMNLVSGQLACETNDVLADGKAVWF